jgi:hypothetical protein
MPMDRIPVTRSDIDRILLSQTMNQNLDLSALDDVVAFNSLKWMCRRHSIDDVFSSLVRSALGVPGPMSDALDVFDDAGVLTQRVWGALYVGWYHLAVCWGYEPIFLHFDSRLSVAERDGLPTFRLDADVAAASRTGVWHTGEDVSLVPSDHNTLVIHRLDAEKFRGRWFPEWGHGRVTSDVLLHGDWVPVATASLWIDAGSAVLGST